MPRLTFGEDIVFEGAFLVMDLLSLLTLLPFFLDLESESVNDVFKLLQCESSSSTGWSASYVNFFIGESAFVDCDLFEGFLCGFLVEFTASKS